MTLWAVILLAPGLWLVQVYGQQSACQSSFVNALYQCLSNRTLDRDNFLWLARGGQLGTPPADIPVFIELVCIEKQGLNRCVKNIMGKVQSLSESQCPQTQKDSIGRMVKEMFRNVNTKCQHPCHSTFKQSLEKCFTERNFVSTEYLIFNVTNPRDSIIGSSQPDIDRFCQVRSDVITCLKIAAGVCDDSRILLRSYGLDLDALEMTYTLLCNSPALYRDARECYRSSETVYIQCRTVLSTNMAALETQLAEMNITDYQYRDQACLERINHFQCELVTATTTPTPQNQSNKCSSPAVLGLRRQQGCSLFPMECRNNSQTTLDKLCLTAEFHIPERQFYTAAANYVTTCVDMVWLSLILVISVVI